MPATFNARGIRGRETDVPHRLQGAALHHPATGFYEWTGEKRSRQPHLFTLADGSPVMGFAGLWDRWKGPATGDWILSCTIIVCGAMPGWSSITTACR